jgi:hypothetical protein
LATSPVRSLSAAGGVGQPGADAPREVGRLIGGLVPAHWIGLAGGPAPADRAQTINGISNKKGGARGRAADPEFGQLLAAIQRVQASGAVGLRTEVSKETKQEATALSLGRKDIAPETLADQARVRKLLGLRPGLREFKVVYGALAENNDVIAIQTRSGFQIMVELASEIQVPADHAADRRTYPSSPGAGRRAGRAPSAGSHSVGNVGAGRRIRGRQVSRLLVLDRRPGLQVQGHLHVSHDHHDAIGERRQGSDARGHDSRELKAKGAHETLVLPP